MRLDWGYQRLSTASHLKFSDDDVVWLVKEGCISKQLQ